MTHYRSLSHTKWRCQYHVVFIPKYRKKVIYGELRRDLGEVLRRLAQQRESEVEEGHLMVDHVHIMIARHFAGRPRNFVGQHFWARRYSGHCACSRSRTSWS